MVNHHSINEALRSKGKCEIIKPCISCNPHFDNKKPPVLHRRNNLIHQIIHQSYKNHLLQYVYDINLKTVYVHL